MPPTSIPRVAMRWPPPETGGGDDQRDVEKVRGARDAGSRVELGPGRKAGSVQNKMAFLCVGLMCEHARRGLSKKVYAPTDVSTSSLHNITNS